MLDIIRAEVRTSKNETRKEYTMEACNNSGQAEQLKKELLECRRKDFGLVLDICPVLEDYALRTEDQELLGFVYFYRGEAYYVLNEVEEMFRSMAKAMLYLEESGQWELLTRAYNMMAIASINKGHAPVALDYYLTALKTAREHGVDSVICSIHINLGYLYMQNDILDEAQHHFDAAYEIYSNSPDKEAQIGRLNMIYTNLVTCYMLRGDMENAKLYMERLMTECSQYFNNMDYVYVGCMVARYYHLNGACEERDKTISDILNRLGEQLPILDLFDDLYSLCELALDIENYDVFTKIVKELEPVIMHTGMVNLQRKLLSIQIKYYEMTGDEENYLQAVSRFYKLVAVMEEESHVMIANMMYVRTALERAKESKQQIEEMNAILMQKSETDPLSGLANRYRMMDVFQLMLEECRREQKLLAVEIIDIDYFKEYNDNYGHQAGDECIRKVASVIKAMQSESVFCVRYGGDEFIILYCGQEEQEIFAQAQKLRQDIASLAIAHAYSKAASVVTVSQGICMAIPEEGDESLDFLHVADEYLYQVKRQERNRICVGDRKENWYILDKE